MDQLRVQCRDESEGDDTGDHQGHHEIEPGASASPRPGKPVGAHLRCWNGAHTGLLRHQRGQIHCISAGPVTGVVGMEMIPAVIRGQQTGGMTWIA